MKHGAYDLYLKVTPSIKPDGGRHFDIKALQVKPDGVKHHLVLMATDKGMTADLVIHVYSDEPIMLTETEQQKYLAWITGCAKRIINTVPELVDHINGGKPFDV